MTARPPDACRTVVFSVAGVRYGIALEAVERVLAMVAVSPVPGRPDVVLGVINVHGLVVAVIDLRRRLGLPPRALGPTDQLLLIRTPRRTVALPVDDVSGVVEVSAERIAAPSAVVPGIARLTGIAALPDGLMLIHDPDAFLSLEDEHQLDGALAGDAG